ncbi:hypothetical protein VNO77_35076 [Canavalia gladiata]|uniref:Uncharacterized protein n=1 Tax=Canavalia gladiata TaxID=3824 RepID=A0AAN9PXJ9_CANGL
MTLPLETHSYNGAMSSSGVNTNSRWARHVPGFACLHIMGEGAPLFPVHGLSSIRVSLVGAASSISIVYAQWAIVVDFTRARLCMATFDPPGASSVTPAPTLHPFEACLTN